MEGAGAIVLGAEALLEAAGVAGELDASGPHAAARAPNDARHARVRMGKDAGLMRREDTLRVIGPPALPGFTSP